MECNSRRPPSSPTSNHLPEHSHVGVVTTKRPLVERLLDRPDSGSSRPRERTPQPGAAARQRSLTPYLRHPVSCSSAAPRTKPSGRSGSASTSVCGFRAGGDDRVETRGGTRPEPRPRSRSRRRRAARRPGVRATSVPNALVSAARQRRTTCASSAPPTAAPQRWLPRTAAPTPTTRAQLAGNAGRYSGRARVAHPSSAHHDRFGEPHRKDSAAQLLRRKET